eukprot:TRINITY_DN25530_c0_g1_i1.p1 TRINITY_DN25530_c0_g1~~TRINITY_DN25530_c0_g1_i1.p1  ORF type:complete len:605 (-),score=162.60 TRINITY_DN25530_c0_g1_i1:91-1905(-)
MPVKLEVCNGSSCSGNGATLAIRDIEECAFGVADVELTGCLGHCQKGPNCKTSGGSGKAKVHNSLKKFSKIESMIASNVDGFALTSVQQKVSKLKFTARREEEAPDRLAKINEAIKALGNDAQAAAENPALYASVLVMRARELMKKAPADAIQDAKKAMAMHPQWAWGQIAYSQCLEAMNRTHGALAAMQEALKIGGAVDATTIKRQVTRLEKRAAEAPPDEPLPEAEAPPAGAGVGDIPEKDKPKAKTKAAGKPGAKKPSSSTKGKEAPKAKAEVKEEVKPVEDQDMQDWSLKAVNKPNHDCLRLEFACVGTPPQKFNDTIWHVDLEFGEIGEEVKRAYTPVSTIEDLKKGHLDLLIKIYPDGKMSQHVAKMKPGDNILVTKPVKTLEPSDYKMGLVMVAGGSAVTVALQVCEAVLQFASTLGQVHLALCNRTKDDVLLEDRFEELLTKYPACFHVTHCISQGELPTSSGLAKWHKGRVNQQVLSAAPKHLKAVISGPGGLCRTSFDILKRLGRTEDQIAVLDDLPEAVSEPPAQEQIAEPAVATAEETKVIEPLTPPAKTAPEPSPGGFWSNFLSFASCRSGSCRAQEEDETTEADGIARQA